MTGMKLSYLIVHPGKAHALTSSTKAVRRDTSWKAPCPAPRSRRLVQAGWRGRDGHLPVNLFGVVACNSAMIGCTALDFVAVGIENKLVAHMLVLALAIDDR